MRRLFALSLFLVGLCCLLSLTACAPPAEQAANDDSSPSATDEQEASDETAPSDEDGGDTPDSIHAGQGILVGGVDTDRALIQVRLTKTDKLVDGDVPGAAGIVDPTKVVRIARENAGSVAGVLLLTGGSLTEVGDREEKEGN